MKNITKIFLLFLMLIVSNYSLSKPRTVFIDTELQLAKFIGEVTVLSYTDSTINYLHGKDTLISFTLEKILFEEDRKYIIKQTHDIGEDTNYLTGSWPKTNDKVLLVTDSNNNVSLFAKKTSSYYRFWSPTYGYWTMSISMFVYPLPYKVLPSKKEMTTVNPESELRMCWDGCIIDKKIFQKKFLKN